MKKILVVITTGVIKYGGLLTVMRNYLYNMDTSNLDISIVSCNEISLELNEEFKSKNIRYHKLYPRKKNPIRYAVELFRLIKKEKYSIVHINGNSSTMIIETMISILSGIKNRIVHCHTTNSKIPLVNTILLPLFNRTYTMSIAVSNTSGKWLYRNKEYIVLKNAIKVSNFSFNNTIRDEYRKKLNVRDNIVIGTIGKLNKPKNHIFLLEVLKILLHYNDKYMLVLVGEGSEREHLKRRAIELNVQEHVIMLGARVDNSQLLQAMDIFVFPSVYEGFGMALVEAQASGMPCICSNRIPQEAQICKDIEALELKADKWAESISQLNKQLQEKNRMSNSKDAIIEITKNGLSIDQEASKLRSIYDSL